MKWKILGKREEKVKQKMKAELEKNEINRKMDDNCTGKRCQIPNQTPQLLTDPICN